MPLLIKEFLPNPVGKDREGEYFTLLNDSGETIFLSGWRVEDESGKAFWLYGSLEAQKERDFFSSSTGLALNNDGETLFLFNESSELVDELGYSGSALEGRMVARTPELTPEIIKEYFDPLAFKPLSASAINAGESPWLMLISTSVLLAFAASLALQWAHQIYGKDRQREGVGSAS